MCAGIPKAHHNSAPASLCCPERLVAVFVVDRGSHHEDTNWSGAHQRFAVCAQDAYGEIVGAAKNIG